MVSCRKSTHNPKQDRTALKGRESWFPYYAGFSGGFARNIIKSAGLPKGAAILDPWNGAGTTTSTARELGYTALGYDLNPVMVVAAKARLLSAGEKSSLEPLSADIIFKAKSCSKAANVNDALCAWLSSESAGCIRKLDLGLRQLLTSISADEGPISSGSINDLSEVAAFFYVALFRLCKNLLASFIPSNPTWTKVPKSNDHRLHFHTESIYSSFRSTVREMADELEKDCSFLGPASCPSARIEVGNCERIQLNDGSVDLVLGSPPYCTRIDYAVATMIELAILGYGKVDGFDSLRRSLIGTSTVPSVSVPPAMEWGNECNIFLDQVFHHKSKSSKSYYFKSHVQYFHGMFNCIKEISRVLKCRHVCIVVVQDSFYKDVHNNLPVIVMQMSQNLGMELANRVDFATTLVKANMHPSVRKYRSKPIATESVLWLRKVS